MFDNKNICPSLVHVTNSSEPAWPAPAASSDHETVQIQQRWLRSLTDPTKTQEHEEELIPGSHGQAQYGRLYTQFVRSVVCSMELIMFYINVHKLKLQIKHILFSGLIAIALHMFQGWESSQSRPWWEAELQEVLFREQELRSSWATLTLDTVLTSIGWRPTSPGIVRPCLKREVKLQVRVRSAGP